MTAADQPPATDHVLSNDWGRGTVTATCSCGQWSAHRPLNGPTGSLTRLHAQHAAAAELDLIVTTHVDHFARTRHCGKCGQPGSFCLCTEREPCGCRDLHRMGSGIGVDAADVFADRATVPSDDQEGLF